MKDAKLAFCLCAVKGFCADKLFITDWFFVIFNIFASYYLL